MASNYDTTTKFKVDISELKTAMQEAKRAVAVANSEFNATASAFDDWTKSADGLKAKLKQLDTTLKSQNTILDAYEKQYKEVVRTQGEGSKAADDLKIKINNQKAAINKTEREIDKYNTSLNDLNNGSKNAVKNNNDVAESLDKVEKEAKGAGDGFTIMKGAMANLVADGIKYAIGSIMDLGSAMVNMVKDSVASYAEYEQLIGGVETLFKDSADVVLKYANDAYKSAGLSANEYMETVTSFSASLLQSLGGDTDEAAKKADKAITDMSDNANKMGSDIETLKTAYAGFAKGQFTLLDNLKLGYGGTQEEMKRLLADAQKISGIEYNISSYADIIDAIHVIQEEMGVAGATALEASTTIEGSFGAMRSAWGNLVTGMSDPTANFGQLVSNVVDSAVTVFKNILPIATKAISGLGQLIQKIIPVIKEQLPSLMTEILPILADVGASFVNALISVLPELVRDLNRTFIDLTQKFLNGFSALAPELIVVAIQVIHSFINAIIQLAPVLLQGAINLFMGLVNALPKIMDELLTALDGLVMQLVYGLLNALPQLLEGAITLFSALVDAIPMVISMLLSELPYLVEYICDFIINGVPMLLDAAITLLNMLVAAIPIILPAIAEALPKVIDAIVNVIVQALPVVLNAAITLLMAIINAIPVIVTELVNNLSLIIDAIINALIDNFPLLLDCAVTLLMAIVEAIPEIVKALIKALPPIINVIMDKLKELPSKIRSIGSDIVKGLWNGINDMASWIGEKIKGFGENVLGGIKSFFGINSPSKVMAEEVGRWLPEGIAVGIDKNAKSVLNSMRDVTAGVVGAARDGLTTTGGLTGGVVYNYQQIINSPKSLSRLEIYRQSKNLLAYAGGGV